MNTTNFPIIANEPIKMGTFKKAKDDGKLTGDPEHLYGQVKWVRQILAKSGEHQLLYFMVRADVDLNELVSKDGKEIQLTREHYDPVNGLMAMGGALRGAWLKPSN